MCDTFVCTGSATEDGSVIFGKNSVLTSGFLRYFLYNREFCDIFNNIRFLRGRYYSVSIGKESLLTLIAEAEVAE